MRSRAISLDSTKESFLELGWVVLWRGKDVTPPMSPAKLSVRRDGANVTFAWPAATDNIMVRNYEILRKEGEKLEPVTISTMDRLTIPATKCPPGRYVVRAVDVAGNASVPSPAAELAEPK